MKLKYISIFSAIVLCSNIAVAGDFEEERKIEGTPRSTASVESQPLREGKEVRTEVTAPLEDKENKSVTKICRSRYATERGIRSRKSGITYATWHTYSRDIIGLIGIKSILNRSLENLQHLCLHGNKITSTEMELLSKGNWPQLAELDLSNNSLGDEGVASLVKGNWPQLTKLNLSYQGYESSGEHSELGGCIRNKGIKHLSQSNWPKLSILNLENTLEENMSVSYLVKGNWPQLTELNLSYHGYGSSWVGDIAIPYLITANWPELRSLNLGGTQIGDEGINHLVRGNWPKLKYLNLYNGHTSGTRESEGHVEILRKWPFVLIKDNSTGALIAHIFRSIWAR